MDKIILEDSIRWYSIDTPPLGVPWDILDEREGTIHLDNLGITRECVVQEIPNILTLYFDKKTGWLLRIVECHDSSAFIYDLIETNVPL